jgi:hypothetical protein
MNEGDLIVGLVFVWLVVGGLIGAAIGSSKDNGGSGFALGALLGPIGWIIAAILDYPRKCPACLGGVPEAATVCKNCGRELPDESVPSPPASALPEETYSDAKVAVYCPACKARLWIYPNEQTAPQKCSICGIGFVPKPSKSKR